MPFKLDNKAYLWLAIFLLFLNFVFGLQTGASFILRIPINATSFFLALQIGIFLVAFFFFNYKVQLITLVGLSFMGIDYILYLTPFFLIPHFLKKLSKPARFKFKTPQLIAFLLLVYALCIAVVMSSLDFGPFNYFVWILTFGSWPLTFIYYSQQTYSHRFTRFLLTFFKSLILLQLILVVCQAIMGGRYSPGDWSIGSLRDANKVAFFEINLLLYYVLIYLVDKKKPMTQLLNPLNIVTILVLLLFIYMTEAKTILGSYLLLTGGFFVLLFFKKLFFHLKNISFGKVSIIFLLLVFAMVNAKFLLKIFLDNLLIHKQTTSELVETYTEAKKTSFKFVLYKRVYVNMMEEEPLVWFFGAGPGKLGSRASNSLAYDVLYKEEHRRKTPGFMPAHSSIWVVKYMHDLWTKKIAITSDNRSSMLSYPFAGFISIKAELGWPGLVFFLAMCTSFTFVLMRYYNRFEDTLLKRWILVFSVFWMVLPLLNLFDNFHEKPQMVLPISLLSIIIINTKRASPTLLRK